MKVQVREGQVGLILLVIMGLVVGIALSLASRSLSDTVLSRQEAESSKAFRLAETGIEQALNALRSNELLQNTSLEAGSAYTGLVNVAARSNYGLYVKEGEQAYLDTNGFSGTLNITWTKEADLRENPATCSEGSGGSPAAIEVMMGLNGGSSASFAYFNSAVCSPSNNFADSDPALGGTYVSTTSVFVPANTESVRIRPIYADATIEVSGSNLATQLYLIQAKAEGGDAHKEIEVKRGLAAPASIFDYALFSGGNIVK